MPMCRASIEFCALMLLGVVLFTTAFLVFAQPGLPPYARIDAIEERFAPQIERLRALALTSTGTVTSATIQQMEVDRELFDVPGILSALAEFSKDGWRNYGPEFHSVSRRSWSVSKPAPNRPVLNESIHGLPSGADLATLEYAGVVVRPDGSPREYTVLFDIAKLRSAWEAEGGAEEE